MTRSHVYIDRGAIREPRTRFGGTSAASAPRHDTLEVYPGETLAQITQRAYGANTPRLRDRIRGANANLEGTVNVPR